MFLLIFTTRSFDFIATGDSPTECREALAAGWAKHCEHTDADPNFIKEFAEDAHVMEVERGRCYRDGEFLARV